MATQLEAKELDLQEQLARIREIGSNSEKLLLEGQKLQFERNKLDAERLKLEVERLKMDSERRKVDNDTRLSPWLFVVQATLGAAAIMGAGAALAKLFLT
jgi:hypothetical protein